MAHEFLAKQRARVTEKKLTGTIGTRKASNPDAAAWAYLVRALLNTDETITKR
jgi:hypothetical protein